MKRIVFYIIVISFTACHFGDKSRSDFFQWAPKGRIIDNIQCKIDQSLGYSLFLPSNYTIDRNWPAIYCFDPKGDGRLPVSLFKNIAEKYGFIVIGSNNCKNGLQQTEISHIADILLLDTKEKMAIDPKRIYLAGFSGGARVACYIANNNKIAAGVIACSGATSPIDANSVYNLVGIAGTKDMNYLDMKHLEISLSNWAGHNIFMSFEGIHHWPPETTLEQAVIIMQIFAMRDNLIEKNDTIISDFISNNIKKAVNLESANNPDSLMQAYYLISNSVKIIDGFADKSALISKLDALSKEKSLNDYLEKEKKIFSNEMEKQQIYTKGLNELPTGWWIKEIKNLRNIENSAQTGLEKLYATRLLAYISLLSYSYVNNALMQRNWEASNHYLQIYGLADPENPDYLYFISCYYANNGKPGDAINSLKKAIAFGFNDKHMFLNDPLLNIIRRLPEFNKLMD